MERSNLEIYIDVLESLAQGPLRPVHIMHKTKTGRNALIKQLNFLVNNNLIEKQCAEREHDVYVLTERGLSVLTAFKQVFSIGQAEKATQTLLG